MGGLKEYANYVFDLYGTLIDVWTNERDPVFWERLAYWYALYGSVYTPETLEDRYHGQIGREERRILAETGCAFPEVDLKRIFLRLLTGAPVRRASDLFPQNEREADLWAIQTANFFRIISRSRLSPYRESAELLRTLKARGKGVYLLSNAQAAFTVPEIALCGLNDYFDDLYLSSDRGVKKPDPSFLGDLMKAHGMTAENTVMIGNDLRSDSGSALACGVQSVYINSYCKSKEECDAEKRELEELFGREAVEKILCFGSLLELFETLK